MNFVGGGEVLWCEGFCFVLQCFRWGGTGWVVGADDGGGMTWVLGWKVSGGMKFFV